MNLDKNHRIISDKNNFILQRRIKLNKERTDGAREWQNVGYWKELSQALKSYSRLRRRSMVSKTQIAGLLEAEDALSRQIEAIGKQCKVL